MTDIKYCSFGFPQNITVENTIDSLELLKKTDYTNKNVHFKLTLDKLLGKSLNQQELIQELKEATHANTVKVTFVYNNESSIRSKEIAEQKNVVDKFKAYAELNKIKYPDSVIEKIEQIQDNMLLEDFTPHDSFTLISASIRGAIGLMDQGHRDEVNINFLEDFEEGIIAITGEIGSGKSTLLENLSPYPCMLTRSGSLKDHFCLKDSHRILTYRTSTGKFLRLSMFIDGRAKNVMNRYFVEAKENKTATWYPIRSCDGSTESYERFVESTFGPKSLFLRTSFYTNSNIKRLPDLAQATKSEKMELFSVLAGTDYLSVFSEQAKLHIKDEEKAMENIKSQLKNFDNLEERQSINNGIILENTAKIEEYKSYIETDTAELDKYTDLQEDYIKAAATYDIYRNQNNEKSEELIELQKQLFTCNNNIEVYTQQLSEVDLYKEQLVWYDENMLKRKELIVDEQKTREQFNTLQISLDKKQTEYNKHQMELVALKGDYTNNAKELSRLKQSIPDLNGTCPVCGAPLESHKKEQLQKEVDEINSKVSDLENEQVRLSDFITTTETWLNKHSLSNLKNELTALNDKLVEISNNISDIDSYAESINVDEIKDILQNSQKALDIENARKADFESKIEKTKKEILVLDEKLNTIPTDYSDKIERLKRGITDSQQQIATLSAEITMANKELELLKQSESLIKDIKTRIKSHQTNIKDYEIIQSAFSNNGIQALELDSAAPEISDIANSILKETYGDRFSISFDTQRDTKDGHTIDDFVIKVFDANSGREKRLDLISSGEGALIKQTLYYAFSVIRMRRTGFCFRTRFLDESDGSLDSDTRIQYLKMIEAAHNQCKAVQTILITHSQELKELIDQKIEL